jgi:hypothetical protein
LLSGPRKNGESELADPYDEQVDTDYARQCRHKQTVVSVHPVIQLTDARTCRLWRYQEAHDRDLSQRERHKVEEEKCPNLRASPDSGVENRSDRYQIDWDVVMSLLADTDASEAEIC